MFRYLSPGEYDTTMNRVAGFEGHTGPAGRLALGILLGLHGLRCGEVCGLTVGDFDAGAGAIDVATLKRGRPRAIELEKRFLGHRSMASTSIYAESVNRLRDYMPRMPTNEEFQPVLFDAG